MKLLSLVRDDPRRPTCEEHGPLAIADVVLSFSVGRLALCADCVAELRRVIGRDRRRRSLNRKQYTALATIARAPGQRASYDSIVKAMGRYATNSFNSCVARGFIAAAGDGNSFELTAAGRELFDHTEANL